MTLIRNAAQRRDLQVQTQRVFASLGFETSVLLGMRFCQSVTTRCKTISTNLKDIFNQYSTATRYWSTTRWQQIQRRLRNGWYFFSLSHHPDL